MFFTITAARTSNPTVSLVYKLIKKNPDIRWLTTLEANHRIRELH
jgi:hypothetical protein